jgi:SRSO17 transposase
MAPVAIASRIGQALIDRRLYLPEAWAKDDARRRKVQVPGEIAFATKPTIAGDLIAAALDAGVPCAFVLADTVYGSDFKFRRRLEDRGQPYVLAVRSTHHLKFIAEQGLVLADPATLADELAADAWVTHAAGEGTKGLRLYDWARISLPWMCEAAFERWLLIRRSRKDPGARTYDLVFARAGTSLAELAGAAGLRWTIEECFERAKGDLGLDHCEARSWHGWHRHMTLCMAAAAFLAKLEADLRRATWASASSKPNERSPEQPVAA